MTAHPLRLKTQSRGELRHSHEARKRAELRHMHVYMYMRVRTHMYVHIYISIICRYIYRVVGRMSGVGRSGSGVRRALCAQ